MSYFYSPRALVPAAAVLAMLVSAAPLAAQQLPAPTSEQLVGALDGVFGIQPGKRASHGGGFCAAGSFTPAASAAELVDAPLLRRGALPAVLRFSVGGPHDASDKFRSDRGMAVRLQGGGETYDLVLESVPVFFAATPASFISFLAARVPDPATREPDPRKIAAHEAAHPDGKLQPALLAGHAAPASVATAAFYSTHAFVFTDGAGRRQAARLVAEPAAGVVYLTKEEEKTLPDRFLRAELEQRLARAPVAYTLYAQLPAPGDPLDDPSRLWHGERKVALGRLSVTAPAADAACDPLVFIPLRLPKGIAPTDDPVLKARAEPYALSRARRAE